MGGEILSFEGLAVGERRHVGSSRPPSSHQHSWLVTSILRVVAAIRPPTQKWDVHDDVDGHEKKRIFLRFEAAQRCVEGGEEELDAVGSKATMKCGGVDEDVFEKVLDRGVGIVELESDVGRVVLAYQRSVWLPKLFQMPQFQ